MRAHKAAFCCAFGGIICGVCVALEFLVGVLPMFMYIFPMICSFLIYVLDAECGHKTALSAYIAAAVLSIFLSADKESAMVFCMFFGYYPVLRDYIGGIKGRVHKFVVKLAVFNAAIIAAYLVIIYIFGITDVGFSDGAKWFWIGLLAAGNAVFLLFDKLLDGLMFTYQKKLRPGLFKGTLGGRR